MVEKQFWDEDYGLAVEKGSQDTSKLFNRKLSFLRPNLEGNLVGRIGQSPNIVKLNHSAYFGHLACPLCWMEM